MVDTVDTLVLFNQYPWYTVRLLSTSDGTGESDVTKIDKSTLTDKNGEEPAALDLHYAEWDVGGMNVRLEWDHTTDDEIISLNGHGCFNAVKAGPLKDPRSAGGTGDVLLTTTGHSAGDGYTLLLTFKMRPASM